METVSVDVVVVGTGGAALVAALSAQREGANVALLEKSELIGGTTCMSGGLVWIPNNHHMRAEGLDDSDDDALRYFRTLAAGRREEELLRTVISTGPEMIRFLESRTSLAFETLDKPDYHPELPGARMRGRCLAPNLFRIEELGAWGEKLRAGQAFSLPLSWREFDATNAVFHPERLDMKLVERRQAEGFVGMGVALISHLVKACLKRGIDVHTDCRARELVLEGERVCGVHTESRTFRAERGVVLACGGFEGNPELLRSFASGPVTHPLSNPHNEGDGLVMAMAIGAALADMPDVLRFPATSIPGEMDGGRPVNRMVGAERALPHTILVNRRGRRFVNEAHNYTDVGRAFGDWDPVAYTYANQPAWAIFDQQYRDQYMVQNVMPGEPSPDWLARAESLPALAERVGIDPTGLAETVERWNGFVAAGVDRDFRRGESWFDTYYADNGREPSATLGSIEKPPFHALPVYCGAIGSSGGPRTNASAAVVHVTGRAIPGLFAAGDAAASALGPGYGGPGGPLGQGFTMGYVAGRNAARG